MYKKYNPGECKACLEPKHDSIGFLGFFGFFCFLMEAGYGEVSDDRN